MNRIVLSTILLLSFQAHSQQAVCARSSSVTLREEPSAKAAVTWKVGKYMPFVRQEKKGEWVKVTDLEGVTHWGRARDFRTDIRCVVVKVNAAKLRVEPRQEAAAATFKIVDRFTPLRRINEDEVWLQVEDESGNKSWINESNVWKPSIIKAITF